MSEYHQYTHEERSLAGCRMCGECQGYSHHWIDRCGEMDGAIYTHDCKHCDMKGCECSECDGEGCSVCEGEGVLEMHTWCEDCENILCTCDDEDYP